MAADRETWERQAEMLVNRIRKNRRRLGPWLKAEGISCFRLYDRDIPELPLVVDWYEGRLHVSHLSRDDGADPEAPAPAAPGALSARAEHLAARVAAALDVPADQIHLKRRDKAPGGTQYDRLRRSGREIEVGEGGHRFLVNLSDYVDTGLFLDHRITRRLVAAEARGRRFLNLFAYTGSFTVYAAAAGAASTTTVDLSQRYLDWAERNLRLNGLAGPAHRLVRDDAIAALEDGRVAGGYELVVVDPPTVSKSKRMRRPFDVQGDHAALLRSVLGVTAPGGVVYFSTNLRRFALDFDPRGAAEIEDISAKTIPPDFRDPKTHRCFRIVKR
ncbi:MAG: class I SAM-dependent methyltransferase [Proteobacteria bacterium]|jgi:23S rRNA (guanine2445-N2)-methyltransferase / 23S rRNA (guanine2069-N7)-methyltransferase|nr:class I SAM-dependent methyltransferase [Pseudomonadota bacterium]